MEIDLPNASIIREEDVLQAFKDFKLDINTTRKTEFLDPRNFLINILYHRFNWVEEDIAALIGIDRSAIWHAKNKARHLWNDIKFQKNTVQVRERFPTWLPPIPDDKEQKFGRKINVTLQLSKAEYAKLSKLRDKIGVRNLGTAAKDFIFTNIDQVI
jgi:hypothetical protein